MTQNHQIEKIFKDTGALINGHFILASGLHSPQYLQCAKVLQWPKYADICANMLATKIGKDKPDLVVSPAMGGVIIGHALSKILNCRAIFVERKHNSFELRRGFSINKSDISLVVEDVITTGGSALETVSLIKEYGASVQGVASIIDRSNGKAFQNIIHHSLWQLDLPSYRPEECPLCKLRINTYKPGSG